MNIRALLRQWTLLFILLGVCAGLALFSSEFLTISNILNVSMQTSIVAITAIGMTFTILSGGIDLSVGSMAAFCGALSAGFIVRNGLGSFSSIVLVLIIGCGLGGINGLMVVKGRIPPFIATLSMMAVLRGSTLVYTQGRPIVGLSQGFTFLGTGTIGTIPMLVVFMIFILGIAYIILRYTRTGLYLYAIGGNEETARLAGINIQWGKVSAYMFSGLTASLAGILLTARLWSAQPTTGIGLELEAIAASVLGGTSLMGGIGSAGGTVVGAFMMGVLSNGLNLLEITSYYQQVAKGAIFIIAVLLMTYYGTRSKKD